MTSEKSFGLLNWQLMQSYDHIIFYIPQIRLWQSQVLFGILYIYIFFSEGSCGECAFRMVHHNLYKLKLLYVMCYSSFVFKSVSLYSGSYSIPLCNVFKTNKKLGYNLKITIPRTTAWY